MADDALNGRALARWQGKMEMKLETHEARIVDLTTDYRARGVLLAQIHDDILAIGNRLTSIEKATSAGQQAGKFRWTKIQVSLAAASLLAFLALQMYLAVKK